MSALVGRHQTVPPLSRKADYHRQGLLQDYRFVLLDAFVRFLANALLAAIMTALVIGTVFRMFLAGRESPPPLNTALLLIGVCLFLVGFAWLRGRVQSWLTGAIFRQGSLSDLAIRVKVPPELAGENQYVEWAASMMAGAAHTKDFVVVDQHDFAAAANLHFPALVEAFADTGLLRRWVWAEVVAPLRLGPGNWKVVLLGRRRGGQRYLGEDLEALARVAAEIAEHVESLRRKEMHRLVSQAELRALQSQINPHFLFNALNALYGTIPREASGARRMVLNLAEVFRYFLQSEKTFVPLSREMEIVRAYLEVEQLRLGDRLEVAIQIEPAALPVAIPVLSVQPLVENAIKHGVAANPQPGFVHIRGELRGEELHVVVENSGAGTPLTATGTGVGIQNLTRRLEICYGSAAVLTLTIQPLLTIAELCIPLPAVRSEVFAPSI